MQCKAKARSTGNQCSKHAIEGGTVCRYHGGASPQARKKAAERVTTEKAAAAARLFALPKDINPADALIDLVKWTAGEVDYWRAEVQRIAAQEPAKLTAGITRIEKGTRDRADVDMRTIETVPHIAYRMLTDAQERLAKFATAALRAGVDERRVKLAEDQGRVLVDVVKAILDRLDLTEDQQGLIPTVVPETIRLFASGGQVIAKGA